MRITLVLVFITAVISQVASAQSMGYIEEFTQIINGVQLEQQSAYLIGSTPVADSCTVFITKDQFVGKIGQTIVDQLTQAPGDYGYLLHGGSLNDYCPKYKTMTTRQKSLVWVLFMTVMSQFESSCRERVGNKDAPNGTAAGYFQLHNGLEYKYVDDPRKCPKNSSTDPVLATVCALTMLEKQMKRTGGDLFDTKSYWAILRRDQPRESRRADDLASALNRSSLCNPKML